MRMQLVSRIFAPEAAAASFRLEALVQALAEDGTLVKVLTTWPAPGTKSSVPARVEDLDEVTVTRLPALRDKTGYIRGFIPYLSFDVQAFLRLLFTKRANIYVSEPPPTTGVMLRILTGLKRRPYVYYAADIWSDAAQAEGMSRLVCWTLRAMERFALRGAAAVISVSDHYRDRCLELGARQAVTVPHGIDTTVFCPTATLPLPIPQENGSTADPKRGVWLVYAGIAAPRHGAEIFAEAFALIAPRYPQARLLFLGQGSGLKRVRQVAARLAPGRLCLGQVEAVQAAGWQRVAIACLASLKPDGYEAAYPTKMFTALACGTPVIYTGDGPGAVDVRDNKLGWAVEYRVEAVAAAMELALQGDSHGDLVSWVVKHHSAQVSARKAAAVVRSAA